MIYEYVHCPNKQISTKTSLVTTTNPYRLWKRGQQEKWQDEQDRWQDRVHDKFQDDEDMPEDGPGQAG
jgi:hypothetical protein